LLAAAMLAVAGATLAFADGAPAIPANVQAIFKKIGQGIPPTAAEKKALADWQSNTAKSLGGGAPAGGRPAASRVAGYFSVGVTSAADNPCHPAGKAAGLDTTPSQAAYLAMARDALDIYQAHLTAAARASLNTALAQSRDAGTGAAMAPIFVLHGNGSAAVVAAAYSAQKDAGDATTANNLGAILRGLHDYARAAIALEYARSLAPKSAMVASNLGWLAMSQGDLKTAAGFFGAAVQSNAKLGPAQLGEGLAALCSGKPAQALTPLRTAIADGDYSDVAADAVYSADEDLVTAKDAAADTTPPGVYGGNAQGGSSMPDFKDPPFPRDAAKLAADYAAKPPTALRAYLDKYLPGIKADAGRAMQSQGSHAAGPSTTRSGNTLVFNRGDGKAIFEISDILGIMSREANPILKRFDDDVETAVQKDGCHGCGGNETPIAQRCGAVALFKTLHGGLYAAEQGELQQLRSTIGDLYGFTNPLIGQIRDPGTAAAEDASRSIWAADELSFFASDIPKWEAEGWAAMDLPECGRAPPPAPQALGKLKPYKIDPTKCNSGTIALNMGFANLNADCSKLALTIGEGLVGALEWKFAPDYTKLADGTLVPSGTDWSRDQVTIFVGAGGANPGPLGVNGAVGGFFTMQNGEITDAGGQAQVGISPGVTAGGANASAQGGMTGRVGIESGPDVSVGGGLRMGAPCGVSC
jgi:tetratricopeptide (TPR) repeat protein